MNAESEQGSSKALQAEMAGLQSMLDLVAQQKAAAEQAIVQQRAANRDLAADITAGCLQADEAAEDQSDAATAAAIQSPAPSHSAKPNIQSKTNEPALMQQLLDWAA